MFGAVEVVFGAQGIPNLVEEFSSFEGVMYS